MSTRILPQWLIDAYPWLNDLIAALSYLQELWHQYQNLVILVGLIIVARRLRQERIKLGERVDTLSQIVKATRDQSEDALALPQDQQSRGSETESAREQQDSLVNWEAIRTLWRNIRDRLELAIEQIPQTRVRGKYSKLSRYTYRDVINALEKDRVITPTVSAKLRSMDTTFNTLKFRPKSVTSADAGHFKQLSELPDAKLPRLSVEETSADSPTSQQQAQESSAQAA